MSIWSLTYQKRAYLSTITVTNIYQSFTYKMAAKINWHRYGTKLRHCHPVHSNRIRKMSRSELEAWDRQTDRHTDGQTERIIAY